jgi:hypothetical protein
MKALCLFILFVLGMIFIAGCTTERERRGVSHIPFNNPGPEERRTFNGDF